MFRFFAVGAPTRKMQLLTSDKIRNVFIESRLTKFMDKKLEIGGQAIIEGVMMRSPNFLIVSAIDKNGRIISKEEKIRRLKKPFRLPFIRGIFQLIDTLIIGMKALTWSANIQTGTEEKLSAKEIIFTILISVIFALGFFIALPLYITKLVTVDKGILFNIIDGIFRIGLFIIYILIISTMKDVKRIFQYHGAEHKAVNCYENNETLTVKNIKKYSTLHPRCGTAFLVIVLIISIVVFSFITNENIAARLIGRIILIPVIAGISFEILKLSGKLKDNLIVKILNVPGLAVQKLTTKEPDENQIKVAIASLKKVIEAEKKVR